MLLKMAWGGWKGRGYYLHVNRCEVRLREVKGCAGGGVGGHTGGKRSSLDSKPVYSSEHNGLRCVTWREPGMGLGLSTFCWAAKPLQP